MRLLVTEFISGGGFVNDPLPRGLKQEGLHMMQALVADCMRINDCQVTATIDPRIQFDNEKLTRATIHSNAHYRDQVFELAKNFDLVWVIAPESEGVLGELVNQLLVDKNILVNCDAESIRIGGDKLCCEKKLKSCGLPVIPCLTETELQNFQLPVIVKPRYGVGCENIKLLNCGNDALSFVNDDKKWVVQPFVQGQHSSLSLLCHAGKARVLSCNIQEITGFPTPKLEKCIVNAFPVSQELELLANQIAVALPGLNGYVGVDIIIAERDIFIVEINPRLTTSYVGLSAALRQNPAQLCIDIATGNGMPEKIQFNKYNVEVVVE